jgi:hypothetical protein
MIILVDILVIPHEAQTKKEMLVYHNCHFDPSVTVTFIALYWLNNQNDIVL